MVWISGIFLGLQYNEKRRENVTVLLNDVRYSFLAEFGCGSSEILSLQGLRWVWVALYGSTEDDDEVRVRFWNDLDRLCNGVISDLKRWIGDRVREHNRCIWSSR